MGYGRKRVPEAERYQGRCENCGAGMWMPEHGWSQARRSRRRWCSRPCRTAGNHHEERVRRDTARLLAEVRGG